MTREGEKLVGVDPEQLRQQLRRETNAKAAKQLTVALLYDAGFSPYQIEEILGFPAQTGYNWLDVVAERGGSALGDAPRLGRHPRLSPDQWTELTATLHAPPTDAGYSDPAWTPPLVRHHIQDVYDIEYSQAHIYRLMHKAGLSIQTARPRHYKADPAEQRHWRTEFKKSGRR